MDQRLGTDPEQGQRCRDSSHRHTAAAELHGCRADERAGADVRLLGETVGFEHLHGGGVVARQAGLEAPPEPAGDVVTEPPEDGPQDDLTAIRGIGAATQKRLNAAGIKSYAQLADADPEYVCRALNEQQQNTKVERWISHARELVLSDWRPI